MISSAQHACFSRSVGQKRGRMIIWRMILCLSVFAWKMYGYVNVRKYALDFVALLILILEDSIFQIPLWIFCRILKHPSILALALGAWLMIQSIDVSCEQHVWPIFVGRCLFDSWFICDGTQKFIKWVYFITFDHPQQPAIFRFREAIDWLWRSVIVVLWLPYCAYVIWTAVGIFSTIVTIEIAVDEFMAWRRRYYQHIVIDEPTGDWKVITALGNVHKRRRFDAAKVFDFHDDPISCLFVVESEERNAFRRVITFWQVSLLNGNKKKIHEFNQFTNERDGPWFQRYVQPLCKIQILLSNGVAIFGCFGTLFIYDSKYGKFATCGDTSENYGELIGVQCLGRLFNSNGTVNGWRIRCVSYDWDTIFDDEDYITHKRLSLRVVRFELREEMEVIELGSESILFKRSQVNWNLVIVRGRQNVGLRVVYADTGDEYTIVYDFVQEQFLYFSDLDALLRRSDRPLRIYYYSPRPTDALQRGDDNGNLWPSILTDHECAQCCENGVVYRMEFKPSSLKCCALKNLFASHRSLSHKMSAMEFQQETGIKGMEAHFDK